MIALAHASVVLTPWRAFVRGVGRDVPIDTLAPDALGVDVTPRLVTLKVEEPAKRQGGAKVADVATLIDKLRNEAKVIG